MFADLLTKIGLLIAYPFIKRNVKEAERMFEENAELKESIEALQYHSREIDRRLEIFCQRYPDEPECVEYFKKKNKR